MPQNLLLGDGLELNPDNGGLPDDLPALQSHTPSSTPSSPSKRAKFDGPYLKDLYEVDQLLCCAVTTENTTLRPIWPHWKRFRAQDSSFNDQPWVPKHGLQLYKNRSAENIHDAEQFDREAVDRFFQFLLDQEVPKSTFGKAKTFLNAHLKLEHHNRLKETGKYAELVRIEVGKSLTVKSSVGSANRRAAAEAFDRQDDIQAELEQFISPAESREMMMFLFKPKPNGSVAKLSTLNRLIFTSSYNLLSATARRGEELYEQKLVQRSVVKIRQIGPCGVMAEQIVTNRAKHNQVGKLEFTRTLSHMDPLRDSAAHHGLLLLWRSVVQQELGPN